jgi:hypothetical protein
MKALNYKIGALKRKYQMGKSDFEPGTLINKVNQPQRSIINDKQPLSKAQIAIRGMV